MVLQLPVKQEACSKPHYVLLQYVLFLNIEERRDSTVLASEVWMERQHGEVAGMPGRLKEDGQTLHVKDVADKVRGGTGYPESNSCVGGGGEGSIICHVGGMYSKQKV